MIPIINEKLSRRVLIVVIAIFTIICLFAYIFDCKFVKFGNKTKFYTGFTKDSMEDLVLSNKVVLVDTDNNIEYTSKDLGISINYSEEYKYDFNNDLKEYYKIDLDSINFKFNTDKLRSSLEKLNSSRTRNSYAELSKVNGKFEVSKDIKGSYIDVDKLYDDIIKNLDVAYFRYDLSYYYEEFDESKCMYDTYKEYIDELESFRISYSNGVSLSYNDFSDYFNVENNKIVLDIDNEDLYNSVKSFVEENLSYYNTVGMERSFITTSGEEIILSSGTYGDTVDYDAETQFIIDSLNTLTSCENRLPEYYIDLPDFIGDTYIEVSIDDQHLWYYKDDKLLMESDVVTGLKNKRDTPVGIYYISEKINGKYLTGDDYKTWVNKWMRLTNTGVGLHDAYWRGSFGGNIYTYNGSHGCINLPKNFAYELYDIVEKRTPVIIY